MAGPTASKKLRIAAVLIAVIVFAGAALFFLALPKKDQMRLPPENIISYTGVSPDTKMSARITMGAFSNDLENDGQNLKLSKDLRERFFVPYSIKTTLQSEKNGYRDLSWSINQRGVEYFILADGFKPEDKITLILNDNVAYTIPFDWSGRIELPIIVFSDADTKACINISEKAQTLAFCHFITGKKAT